MGEPRWQGATAGGRSSRLIWIPPSLQAIATDPVSANHNRMTALDGSLWEVGLQAAPQPPAFFLQSSQPLHNPAEPDSGGDSENDSLALLPKRTVRRGCGLWGLAACARLQWIKQADSQTG